MAMNRHPVAQNRLPLYPRKPTFSWPLLTSGCDPKRKLMTLRELREKLVKIGAKVVSHGRYVTFQLAEVAVPRDLFRKILRLIDGLRPAPLPPWRALVDTHPGRPTGQVCAAQAWARSQRTK